MLLLKNCFLLASIIVGASAAGLEQIEHVVLFMQENRAFDHYYGTVAGVRGYKDPNVLLRDDGKPIWYQKTSNGTDLLPFYLSENPNYADSSQCMVAGSNDWQPNHNSWNNGKITGWAINNTMWSWGNFRRSDIPALFDIVEGWTVADMYAESVIGPTNPNRVTWASGTINIPGSPPGNPQVLGGPYIENYETDGCQTYANGVEASCYPLKWKTVPEYLEDSSIDWRVFQDLDNFDDNPFAWFGQYQTGVGSGQDFALRGDSFPGLEKFYDLAASGQLPQVSYIIGPAELSEHPPYEPKAGASFQKKIIEAVMNSPNYNKTALLISYDETGGWGDHVAPFVSPRGTPGEWFTNPEQQSDYVPSGPGFRVPFYVISPWTRGGRVFTAPSDHNSQIKFLEQWAKQALNKDITTAEMNQWRRDKMSDLVDIFDFDHPDYSLPNISSENLPANDADAYAGYRTCEAKYSNLPNRRPPVPLGQQTEANALWTEEGYKQIRGALTEGRYLAFRQRHGIAGWKGCLSGVDLGWGWNVLDLAECSEGYKDPKQQWIVYQQGDAFSTQFKIKNVHFGYLTALMGFTNDPNWAEVFDITFDAQNHYKFQSGYQCRFGAFDSIDFSAFSLTYN